MRVSLLRKILKDAPSTAEVQLSIWVDGERLDGETFPLIDVSGDGVGVHGLGWREGRPTTIWLNAEGENGLRHP